MTFKSPWWHPIAVVLAGINLVAAGFAAGATEPMHAVAHGGVAMAFAVWAQRLRERKRENERESEPELGIQELGDELNVMRGELSEMQERMDFVERVLARPPEQQQVAPERRELE